MRHGGPRAPLWTAAMLWAALAPATAAQQEPSQQPPLPQAAGQQGSGQQGSGQQEPGPSLRERAAAAENAGRFGEAADLYLALAQQEPMRASWTLAAGRCLGSSGRFGEAIDFLDAARARFPNLPDLLALQARTYLLRVERDPGALHPEIDYTEAKELARLSLESDPDHLDARLILAQACYSLSDLEGARKATEEALSRHPEHAGSHILAGRIAYDEYRLLKDRFEAEQPPEPRHGEMVTAISAARQRAQERFADAARLDPQRAFALLMLGEIAARDRNAEQAMLHWGKALAVDPLARVDHGWIRARTEPAEREAFYRRALEAYLAGASPQPARAAAVRFYVALSRYEQGQWQQALAEFRAVKDENADYHNADYYASLCAYRTGDEDAAAAHAAAFAFVSAPRFADVLRELPPAERAEVAGMVRHLGDRAYQQGDRDQSRDLNHVTACLQDTADAWNNYAFLCRETGRFDDAFVGYQHALEREPESPQLWNDAAVVLQYHLPSADNLERARRMYGRALELAKAQLADGKASELVRRRAQKAKGDAEANLAALPR